MQFKIIHHDQATGDIEAVTAIIRELEQDADAAIFAPDDRAAMMKAIDAVRRKLTRRTAAYRRTPKAAEMVRQARADLAARIAARGPDRRLSPRAPEA
jgi:hypothetical protein